ncbi:hypothetical protein [Ferruginibacter sp.]|nr:hypothetical protein [Ferruginibacter sp.]
MCAIIKNPLQRDGTSQQDRLLKALLPGNAKIDDRKIEDILAFATEYSKLINYYNTENKPEGDWGCFYDNDPCIQLALLATIDTDTIEAAFAKLEEKINNNLNKKDCGPEDDNENDPLPGYYDNIIDLIYSIVIRIQMACKKLPDGHLLKEEIISIIKNNLHLAIIDNKQQDALIKLIGYDKASIAPPNDYKAFIQSPANSFCSCTKAWQLDQEGYDCIYPDNSFGLAELKSLFYIFFIELAKIKQRAKIYFEECIATNDAHQPHVTLFLTFLYLFQYAIDQLNTLTRSHLLYYYEKVLCLHKLKEVPDKVHVIFELAKNFHSHLIEEGTLLNAGKDDTSKQMVYALMEEVVVNKAKVEEIKTVYIDEVTGVVHAAPKADSKDGIAEAFNKDEQAQWKPLGSNGSPADELGFALASPMFFLKEGLRAGMISYKLKADTDVQLMHQASSYRLLYSSDKDWIEIENIYDVVERILLKYPILQQLYNDNKSKLKDLVTEGFEALKTLYEKLYPAPAAVTAVAVKAAAATKAGKTAADSFDVNKIVAFIEKVDASIIADFLISESASAAPSPDKKIKKAAPAAAIDISTIDKVALQKEIMQVRSDILAIKNAYVNSADEKRKELDFFFIANFTAPAFTPLKTDEKNPDIQSQWPLIKTLVKNNVDGNGKISCQYNSIKGLKLIGADIKVAAYGMKDVVVQNDTAILDNSKEIQPFTARPYKGSYFYLGSKEVFQKKLDVVGVQMEWADKPVDFGEYYKNYFSPPSNTTITNNSFTVDAELLNGGIYQDIYEGSNQKLFNTTFQGKTIIGLGAVKSDDNNNDGGIGVTGPGILKNKASLKDVKVDNATISQLQRGFELRSFARDPFINDFEDYNVTVRRGFMRLSLGKDFLHTAYPSAYTSVVVSKGDALKPADLPNEAYTPKLKNTSLFYVSTERTLFGANKYNATIEQFYHITPFGYHQMEIDKLNEVFLLPQFTKAAATLFTQGNLYIGLKDAEREQKVNILFQVLDGTGDNRFAPPDIEWSYLVNNQWVAFKPFEIQDHTRADESSRKSLLKSGIIEFSLPKAITSEGTTILNSKLLWIRAVAHEDILTTSDSDSMLGVQRIAALPDLVAIIAQAGIAEFEDHNNSLSHLAAPLPAKTIAKFMDSRAAIKKVEQPFYSFDGRMLENDNQFYTRVSERLRHKNRAICIWDYERLVLQAFPQLHKVKCLNHTGIAENLLQPAIFKLREITPGFVTVSVIPDLRNKNAINKLEPRVPVGLLDDIKIFLKKRTNLFVALAYTDKLDYLQVLNPLYEQLKVKACVRFYEGLDAAYYKYILNDELKKFLSPWAFDTNTEINFGSTYHKSAILNFIEERKYVDVVLGFEVTHYKDGIAQPNYDADWIIPTTSRSILTSYNTIDTGEEYEHNIEYVPYDENDPCPECTITTNNAMKKQPVS